MKRKSFFIFCGLFFVAGCLIGGPPNFMAGAGAFLGAAFGPLQTVACAVIGWILGKMMGR